MIQVMPKADGIDWDNLPVHDAYVMGFQSGDLVQTTRSLAPHSGTRAAIPPYSVGSVKTITVTTALVHFLYYAEHWVRLDDLEYATDYKFAPTRPARKPKEVPTC